jgi:ion channel POLLUX/CASTOR
LSLQRRLRYRFDNSMASGTAALVRWLGIASLALVLVVAVVAIIAGVRSNGENVGFIEALWMNLLRTLDPGTMADDGPEWPIRITSLVVTIGGIFLVSSFIGIIASGINRKFEELQRGKSLIDETNHTVILGWSPKVFTILSELEVANENQKNQVAVVLAAHEKVDMDEEIETRLPHHPKTKIICRRGAPSEPNDIGITNPTKAKSIIVLNPGGGDGDAEVIKTVLALISNKLVSDEATIVTELGDATTAESLEHATEGRAVALHSLEIMARLTAQAARQPGLNVVFRDLLDFDGDEIYFHEEPALVGHTFSDALLAFDHAAVIGMRKADGDVVVAPPMETRFESGDKVIAISADDDTIVFTGLARPDQVFSSNGHARPAPPPESMLIVGWNSLTPLVIKQLDEYVPPGSVATIVVDPGLVGDRVNVPDNLERLTVHVESASGTWGALSTLLTKRTYQDIIIMCYRQGLSDAQADARALMDLLQIQRLAHNEARDINIVTELIDVRDVAIAPRSTEDQFIVSEHLISLLMAQLAENAELWPVFQDLMDSDGVELYLKPSELYCSLGQDTTFGHLVASASLRGEVAVGYRKSGPEFHGNGVVLNPLKSQAVTLDAGDSLIVLADDEFS